MLTYPMEERGGLPLYEYLYRRIRADILSGALAAGERLPSKRALAEHLHLSVITVEAAYQQLEAEGYVYTRPKRGFFVSCIERAPEAEAPPPPLPAQAAATLAAGPEKQPGGHRPVSGIHLVKTHPSGAQRGGAGPAAPVPHQGLPALRQAIADDLRDYKGMSVSPAQIVVGAGAEYLYLLLAQLLGPDAVFAVEDPGYPKIRQVYGKCGARCCPVRWTGRAWTRRPCTPPAPVWPICPPPTTIPRGW